MKDQKAIIKDHFSYLFEGSLLDEIAQVGVHRNVGADEVLIEIGSYVKFMPLLLSGAIKIFRQEKENEQLLYFLEKGDTCAMTLNCCIGQTKSEIKAVAEMDSEMILVPIKKMEDWLSYKSWRSFVFESYNSRMLEMLEAIDSLAFNNLDQRLIKYLKDKATINKNLTIETSHREIAYEMNTSRVVISRVLKKLEKEEKIDLKRNKIILLKF